ncbi:MAG: hypothetical protein IT269_12180 [Saprospiraceae bacterium]|nr:hypothetical protein [Saprospiraceae bacterium]
MESKIAYRISRSKSSIVLRSDFEDMGGYDQIGRALRNLCQKGNIIKIGYGLYAKATLSKISGNKIPIEPLNILAKEALRRLGVEPELTVMEVAYQTGKTTQVPSGRVIAVDSRIVRKIGYKGIYIEYEKNTKQRSF